MFNDHANLNKYICLVRWILVHGSQFETLIYVEMLVKPAPRVHVCSVYNGDKCNQYNLLLPH